MCRTSMILAHYHASLYIGLEDFIFVGIGKSMEQPRNFQVVWLVGGSLQ